MIQTAFPAVLHITTALQGGAGRAITDLALGQRARGHRVFVATSLPASGEIGNDPAYLSRLREHAVPLLTADYAFGRDAFDHLALATAVGERVNLHDIDVVHTHGEVPAMAGMLLGSAVDRRLPVVQTLHESELDHTGDHEVRDLRALCQSSRVIVGSTAYRKQLIRLGVPRSLIVVIRSGLEETAPPLSLSSVLVDRLTAARTGATAIVCCIGSGSASRDQRLLVDALPAIAAKRAVAAFFVGGGALVPELEARARELGVGDRVHVLGCQSNASALLPHVDLLVQPSRCDGRELLVLEAFRARVPVVASRTPSLEELVHEGQTGFLFRSGDARALAAAVLRFLGLTPGLRRAVEERAHAVFCRRYTTAITLDRHADVYRRALGTAGPDICFEPARDDTTGMFVKERP